MNWTSISAACLFVTFALGMGCASGSDGQPAAAQAVDTFAPATGLRLVEIARGLDGPLYVTAPPGDARLFVVEQPGRVRIVEGGRLRERPFLDLTKRVRSGGERGLLSIAFHPAYRTNGFLFVNYTDLHGDTQIERYHVSADPNVADPASARLVLHIDQPYVNHNGGHILFGPDGMLYVGMGDGGSGGDPHGNGQNLGALLGKMLRLDVDVSQDLAAPAYRIPRDNPFVGRRGARPEIWAYGLRNPWRFCFDPPAGLVYIADVGQDRWEEVDVAPMRTGGLNYGWNIMEGRHDYAPRGRPRSGLVMPLVEYSHNDGCSITGGFVCRGTSMPELAGTYFFSDYCRGWIRSFRVSQGRAIDRREWQGLDAGQVTSFGFDAAGEIYVTNAAGRVYRLAKAAPRRG
jgi:glucose/arabinose dehydrogenase